MAVSITVVAAAVSDVVAAVVIAANIDDVVAVKVATLAVG